MCGGIVRNGNYKSPRHEQTRHKHDKTEIYKKQGDTENHKQYQQDTDF